MTSKRTVKQPWLNKTTRLAYILVYIREFMCCVRYARHSHLTCN